MTSRNSQRSNPSAALQHWIALSMRHSLLAWTVVIAMTGCGSSGETRMDHKSRLVDRINRSGKVNDPKTPSPLVTLEEFFEGNDDPASIGCNLPGAVQPVEMFVLYKAVRARSEVAEVLVQVTMHDDPEGWPFSDTVWVITSASDADIRRWIPERLQPDELFDGFHRDRPMEAYSVPKGMRAVGLWYD